MKTRWYMGTFVMIAGFAVILLLFSAMGNRGMTSLPQQYPDLPEAGSFEGRIFWKGEEEGIPVLLTDEQFVSSLCAVQVREKGSFEDLPSPAFRILFMMEGAPFTAVIGADGRICLSEDADPLNTRRFFLDRTGNMYRSLYEEHLQSGGMEIPGP